MPRGKPNAQCITRRCGGKKVDKGLCKECLKTARQLVAAGLTTWAELESLGLAEVGRSSKFLYMFNRETKGRLNNLPKGKASAGALAFLNKEYR